MPLSECKKRSNSAKRLCADSGGGQHGGGVLPCNRAAAGGACHGGQARRRCFLADGFGAGVGGGRVGHLSVRHDDAKLHHPHRALARRGGLARAHYRRRLHRARCADSCGGGAGIVGALGCGAGRGVSGCFGGGLRIVKGSLKTIFGAFRLPLDYLNRQPEKGFLPFSGCLEPRAQQSCNTLRYAGYACLRLMIAYRFAVSRSISLLYCASDRQRFVLRHLPFGSKAFSAIFTLSAPQPLWVSTREYTF